MVISDRLRKLREQKKLSQGTSTVTSIEYNRKADS